LDEFWSHFEVFGGFWGHLEALGGALGEGRLKCSTASVAVCATSIAYVREVGHDLCHGGSSCLPILVSCCSYELQVANPAGLVVSFHTGSDRAWRCCPNLRPPNSPSTQMVLLVVSWGNRAERCIPTSRVVNPPLESAGGGPSGTPPPRGAHAEAFCPKRSVDFSNEKGDTRAAKIIFPFFPNHLWGVAPPLPLDRRRLVVDPPLLYSSKCFPSGFLLSYCYLCYDHCTGLN